MPKKLKGKTNFRCEHGSLYALIPYWLRKFIKASEILNAEIELVRDAANPFMWEIRLKPLNTFESLSGNSVKQQSNTDNQKDSGNCPNFCGEDGQEKAA